MIERQIQNEAELEALRTWLACSRHIVVLTGAGMSTDSGIPDFRSAGGVWSNPDLLDAMTDGYLRRHPEEFWPKYKRVFMNDRHRRAKPNAGHHALQSLEAVGKSTVHIYTQNVDGLHQLAGSQKVWELHGSARTAVCPRCHTRYTEAYVMDQGVPRCTWETPKGAVCETILHPDTVLFGQAVRHMDTAMEDMTKCDLLLVLGTSLTVEPVASLPKHRNHASRLVVINLDATYLDAEADLVVRARIGQVLPQVIAQCGGTPSWPR